MMIRFQSLKPGTVTQLIYLVSLLLFMPEFTAPAQFVNSGITIEGTYGSAVNWVDIECDNDLDLTVSGFYYTPGSARGKLYLNNGSTLVFNRDIRLMQDGDESWCDFNNDGYPDMLYAGKYPTNAYSAGIDVFNVGAGFTWSDLSLGFIPVINASVDWGDYDNDGDYDALISGEDAGGLVLTRIYRNDNSVFSDIGAGIPGVTEGKVAFIDYDLDQDLDIFICGLDVNKNKYTRLWANNGGIFSITSYVFPNLKYSQFDWGDFNSDGYPDLLIGGFDNIVYTGYIYLNNSGTGFSLSPVVVPGCQAGSSGFGDVDNDGDLDVFISGKKQDAALDQKFIYINDGAGSLVPSGFLSTAVTNSFFQFGDWNKDRKLDFVVNGYPGATGVTSVANNNSATANTVPDPPLNPAATVMGKNVQLKWSHATDNNTPVKALTYNIYVGTSSGTIDIVSPNAEISSGFRRISRKGYIQDTAWTVKNLPVGTYHWAVQAIDNSLGASDFSAEGTFTINDRFTMVTYTENPSVSSPAKYFDADHDGDLDMFLNNNDHFYAVENTLVPFSESNYKLIQSTGYNPIWTITPNDYNNNNKIDFTISGYYMGTGVRDSSIALYGYNTPFNYNIINEALVENLTFEYAIWADLDNDGWQDLITSGKTTNLLAGDKPATYIFRNPGTGSLEKVNKYIRGFEKCGAVEGDFDNDMDIDFIVYGKDSTGTADTFIYLNEGDFNFTEVLIPGNSLYRDYFSYGIFTGDFDQNGELDIYMAGKNVTSDYYTRVLLNHGLNFTDANLPIRSSIKMSNFWADYDYDGDLDIFYTSVNATPTDKLRLYLNNSGSLEELIIDPGQKQSLDLPLMAVNLDNKNGLDFILKEDGGSHLFQQYYDNWGSDLSRNIAAPSNPGFVQDQLDIILHWDKIPGCPACTYNIRVGTTPGGVDIESPMSDLSTGYRYVVQPGNTYLNNRWKLVGLPVDEYYWSVQAVNTSNSGGAWSTPSAFTVSLINPNFTFTTVCKGNETTFTDLSAASEPITELEWDFGDGSTSQLKNPTHLYADAGTYTVGLRAYIESGESAYISHTVTVKELPSVDFSADIACQGTPTTFVNNTNSGSLVITSWLWNFGDGATSDVRDPGTHGYLNPGQYQATLVANADNGCSGLKTKSVTVSDYPVAVVTANKPLTFCKGDSVILSVGYDNKYTYSWMSGGMNLTGGDKSEFAVRISGNYSVIVVNTIGNCVTTSSAVAVTVNDLPDAPLITTNGPVSFCQGDSVFLSVPNVPGYIYTWKLDGGLVGSNSYLHNAKSPGNYTLTATNSGACSVNAVNSILVNVNNKPDLPTISINGPVSFCAGSAVDLSVTNIAGLTYQWENNGSAISGATTNKLTANASGVYTLKITNTGNCYIKSESVSVNVLTIPSAPTISAASATTFCQADSVLLSVTGTPGYSYQWRLNGGSVGTNSNQLVAKTSGSYDIVVSNSSGCSVTSLIPAAIVVNPMPALSIITVKGEEKFCSGESTNLSVPANKDYIYAWKKGTGDLGLSTNSIDVTESGNYTVEVNLAGCKLTAEPVAIEVVAKPARPDIDPGSYSPPMCLDENPLRLSVDNIVPGYSYQWYKNETPVGTETFVDVVEAGNYYLEAVSDICSSERSSLSVTFAPAPLKPVIIPAGPTVWYLSTTSKAASYKWYFNGTLIPDATGSSYMAGQNFGLYRMAIANESGCYSFSDTLRIPAFRTTGIEDTDPFADVKIYPNPTTGMFTIEMNNNVFGELVIDIITQNGSKILNIKFEKTTEHFQSQIDLSGQPNGMYLINLAIDKYVTTKKILIE